MDMNLIIQLVAGALGGNAAGAMLKNLDLGVPGNSIAGLIGGGVGGQILVMLGGAGAAAAAGGMDVMSIVSSLVSGGIGGGVLMAIVGVVKNMKAKS